MSPKLRFLLAGTFRILCCWCTVVSKERIRQKIYFNELIKKTSVQFGSLKHGSGIDVTLLIFNHSLGVHFPTPTLNKKHTCVLQPGTRTGRGGPGRGGGVRRVKGRGVGFKNCIRQVSDRALRSFKEALKELLPDTQI